MPTGYHRRKFFSGQGQLHIQLTWKHLVAFLVLVFLLHELHELSHVVSVRALCGCWGERDFLIWKLCSRCSGDQHYAMTLIAGPVLNYMIMWTGVYFMLQSKHTYKRSLGFALIFAALPMARILGTAVGGGDEINIIRLLLQEPYHLHKYFARIFSFVIVLVLAGIPLVVCYQSIANRFRLLLFAGFAMLPLYIDQWVVEGLLNQSIKNMQYGSPRIMGAPLPVIAWFLFLIIMMLFLYKKIFTMAVN